MTPPTVLLTGVSRGLGEALGKAVLAQGWRLGAIGRGSAPEWILASSDKARFIPADMRNLEELQSASRSISEPVDVVINSAAIFGGEAYYARQFDPSVLEEVFRVNVVAPTILARDVRPLLRKDAHRLIIMMSTGNASLEGNRTGEMLAYRASKSALNQMVRTMAAEWRDDDIKVVALNPGWIRTDMGGESAPLSPEEGARNVIDFIDGVARSTESGAFVNTDGSMLPW